jgi:hypothetical protein
MDGTTYYSIEQFRVIQSFFFSTDREINRAKTAPTKLTRKEWKPVSCVVVRNNKVNNTIQSNGSFNSMLA